MQIYNFQRGSIDTLLWWQVSESPKIGSTAIPAGLASPPVRVHASGPVLTEDDQLRRYRVNRPFLRSHPGCRNMGGKEEGSWQRLGGGGDACRPFDRPLRRDIHDDGDLGRRRVHQRHCRSHLHEGPGLVSSAFRIRAQPRFR